MDGALGFHSGDQGSNLRQVKKYFLVIGLGTSLAIPTDVVVRFKCGGNNFEKFFKYCLIVNTNYMFNNLYKISQQIW